MKENTATRFLARLKKVRQEVRNFHRISMGVANVLDDILTQKFDGRQKDFAAFLGKKDSEVSKWFSGDHNFTLKSIAFLEAKLGVNILFTKYDFTSVMSDSYLIYNSKSTSDSNVSIIIRSSKGKLKNLKDMTGMDVLNSISQPQYEKESSVVTMSSESYVYDNKCA